MITQEIYLEEYDWYCYIYYAVSKVWAEAILYDLERIGCSAADLYRAEENLADGNKNTGLTFSNPDIKESIMVLSRTTSAEEFANTFDHEKGHLAKHIAKAYGLDPFGEEVQYLSGDIARKMFPVAKRFMCECCRKKLYGTNK